MQTTTRILELEQNSPGTFSSAIVKASQTLCKQTEATLREIVESYPADCQLPEILAAKLILG